MYLQLCLDGDYKGTQNCLFFLNKDFCNTHLLLYIHITVLYNSQHLEIYF